MVSQNKKREAVAAVALIKALEPPPHIIVEKILQDSVEPRNLTMGPTEELNLPSQQILNPISALEWLSSRIGHLCKDN